MSASEKLRMLESRDGLGNKFQTHTDQQAMYAALPQFIALAEATEWVSESGVYSYERHEALTNALAALEDALP